MSRWCCETWEGPSRKLITGYEIWATRQRVAQTIYDGLESLASFPNRGRPGRTKGTRELVLAPLPFIAVYRLKDKAVEIARVLHGSRRRP